LSADYSHSAFNTTRFQMLCQLVKTLYCFHVVS
jgi:hypothetical protein